MPARNGAGKSSNQIIGGDTLVGQIASFMSDLHLSYREVYEELPYLLLLLMMADKPRVDYGDGEDVVVKNMSGRDMIKHKG